MNRLKEHLISLDSLKTAVPNFFSSQKDKMKGAFSSVTISEADYVLKTENTEKELIDLLISKMDMEVILGLKFVLGYILIGKDLSKFSTLIVNLFLKENYFTRKLCLNIIDYLGLKTREELILLYNCIDKSIKNTDPLSRWIIVHVINSLKNQVQLKQDCIKQLIPLTLDSNPYVRRMALLTIVHFVKHSKNENLIENKELNTIICKYFGDLHPVIFGTAFYAITELKNRDYINLNLPENFVKICKNLNGLEEFYLSRAIFTLINFAKLLLFNNIEKNFKYIKMLFDTLYKNIKKCTDYSKNLTFMAAIYEIIQEIDKQNLNVLLKEEFNIFKNKKRLQKLANILIRLYLSAKNKSNQVLLILDLISKFVNLNNVKENQFKNSISENFDEIRKGIQNYVPQGIFFIKVTDKPFIAAKKLEILINLVNEENIKFIFDEFKRNLNFPINQIKKLIIKAIYFICKIHSEKHFTENPAENSNSLGNSLKIPYICVEKLIDSLKLKEEEIISEVIVSLRKLVNEIKDHTKYILIYSIKNFKKSISSSLARSNIIWMVTQYLYLIPTVSVDFFRRVLIDLENESDEVKSQLISLALKLYFSCDFIKSKYVSDAEVLIEKLKYLIKYCLEKLFYDQNYHVREKARLAQMILTSNNYSFLNKFIIKDENGFENTNENYFKFVNYKLQSFNYFSVEEENRTEEVNNFDLISKETDQAKNFSLSLAYKMGFTYNKPYISEENDENQGENKSNQFENLFFFDYIEHNIDEHFFSICLDDIINLKRGEMKNENVIGNNNENNMMTNKDKFEGVKSQEEKVKNSVVNFDSDLNIEEKRNKLKNQLDDFLNDDNDQEEDEFEVEINKD